jgi:hypothetical protein
MLTTVMILFHRNSWEFECLRMRHGPFAKRIQIGRWPVVSLRCSGQLAVSCRWLSVTERILNIKCAVEKNIGGMARHITSTPVIEVFDGSLMWEGVVETFDVACNPNVKRCYGFSYREDDTLTYATIAETDEVNSPEMAVKSFVVSRM